MIHRNLIAFLALAAPAAAAELRVSTSLPLATYTSPNPVVPFTMPGFDPALGTLTRVRIGVELHETLEARAENQAPSSAALTWESVVGMRVAGLDSTILIDERMPDRVYSMRATPFDGALDFGGSSGFTVTLKATLEDPLAYSATAPNDVARFLGAGPRPFLLVRSGRNLFSATSANDTASLTHKLGARLWILYDYTPAAGLRAW